MPGPDAENPTPQEQETEQQNKDHLHRERLLSGLSHKLEAVKGGVELRPALAQFAGEMEAVLKQNDHKGGWKDCPMEYLRDRLHQEVRELDRALLGSGGQYDPSAVAKECADVANFAMMLRDNVGG
ncbi:MAG: hypothetical protein MOGMAGMI_02313 [Candidatus Omnitrophica bacterium]|nr:hypothetical protein [Candidatus Omnitrophota bacterium]